MSRLPAQLSVPSAEVAIDWDHLNRVTLGDIALADEVLSLFDQQAGQAADAIRKLPPDVSRLAHGLKGSARGIGAVNVAEAAQRLECLAEPAQAREAADLLIAAIAQARAAIAAHLRKP